MRTEILYPRVHQHPRLYEKHMAELEKAQTLLQQQIEEHKMLLDLDMLLNPPEAKKQGGAVPHEHVHEQDPSHTHERPKDSEVVPLPQRGRTLMPSDSHPDWRYHRNSAHRMRFNSGGRS